MSFWNSLDPKLRTAIVTATVLIIGAVTEAILAWVNYLGNQAGV
jgi:hypothetical protein